MALTKQAFGQYIRQFNFRELFNDMGWNNDKTRQPIIVDGQTVNLQAVAEKSGFKIFQCYSANEGTTPDYNTRKKIETKLTKLFQEHLIIFCDARKQEQIWQLVARQSGKPTRVTETRYQISQDPELLYQRASGLFFELDEEEHITIVDVTKRVAENFQQNNERVTKQFYDKFKKEHTSFLDFIKGIEDKLNKDWYASLMLNRLMFCYFIQKKGFLDNNKNYLRDKLKACQEKKGKNQFHSFYRNFLITLFHKGLGSPQHSRELEVEIGRVPYLNGGLFDEHELEKSYQRIEIDDKAFERIFDFFDQYEWHLDTRITASGKDINPDVIGYIFEKYINDRAQMGAYYTKEDITDYISKNCIIPYLFDETRRHYAKGFSPEGEIWQSVKQSHDDYVYDAVKHGINPDDLWGDLPEDIKAGLNPDQPDLVVKRKCWNTQAPSDVALPTEIWREVIDRRKRYQEIKGKIKNGQITSINDFITFNLNIRQLAQDVVESSTDPEFLRHFYKALTTISILDPTCGSGAFLFAAMNVLEPLYEACLQRMENFVREAPKGKYIFFEETLSQAKSPGHPNLQYFIYKSIILHNLYGVDIMREAVEIAKLRLFLKLMATVEANYRKSNLGLEPLPDLDFNIRAGNTLIGYASKVEIDHISGLFIDDNVKRKIMDECDIVAMAFQMFREIQLENLTDYLDFKKDKGELSSRLRILKSGLDRILFSEHYAEQVYEEWHTTHQPFHWFAEFYEIIHDKGGFDVIIGNPPYVEYSHTRKVYGIKNYVTESCGNLYVYTIERCSKIVNQNGIIGMIVQLPIVCTDRMLPIQKLLLSHFKLNVFSTFDDRPGKLFEGLEHIRATIFLSLKSNVQKEQVFSTSYIRWNTEYRTYLFESIKLNLNHFRNKGSIPKIGDNLLNSIFNKILKQKSLSGFIKGNLPVYFHNSPQYWIRATNYVPYFYNEKDGHKTSVQVKAVLFEKPEEAIIANCALNSSLFYLWFIAISDCRHLNMREIDAFPVSLDIIGNNLKERFQEKMVSLMKSYEANKKRKSTFYKATGKVEYDEYYPKLSKPIIDEIDKVLAEHYGFTPEELDFIINYDIKYRMGKELEGGDEGEMV